MKSAKVLKILHRSRQTLAKYVQNKPNYKVLNLDDIIIMSQQAQEQANQNNREAVTNSKFGRKLDV